LALCTSESRKVQDLSFKRLHVQERKETREVSFLSPEKVEPSIKGLEPEVSNIN